MIPKKYKRPPLAILLLLLCPVFIHAQMIEKDDSIRKKPKKESKYDAGAAVLLIPNYTAQFPFGNMKQRFGFNSLFCMEVLYKTKHNWLVGATGGFIYGTKVKENYLLSNIATNTGQFVTSFNDVTSVRLEEYGFNVQFVAGKVIPFNEKYPDAGIIIMTGLGMLQHKIAMNVKGSELPQLNSTYKKGYDRMSNGPVISEFIGGTFMARRKYFSGYIGLQVDAAFTEGRRPYDFYLGQPLNDKRYDLFVGLKIGYILPIFLQASEKEFFYY